MTEDVKASSFSDLTNLAELLVLEVIIAMHLILRELINQNFINLIMLAVQNNAETPALVHSLC